jgi:hypothetical protein
VQEIEARLKESITQMQVGPSFLSLRPTLLLSPHYILLLSLSYTFALYTAFCNGCCGGMVVCDMYITAVTIAAVCCVGQALHIQLEDLRHQRAEEEAHERAELFFARSPVILR